jgi:hypothetical protein
MSQILIDKELLVKFAEFTSAVMTELRDLRGKVEYHQTKVAQDCLETEQYQQAVIKVANALYDSDLDFVTGDFDRRKFIKKAMEDKTYLAKTLEKVCNAADVSLIGKPARVAANKKVASNDPVYARAFGYSSNNSDFIIDLD